MNLSIIYKFICGQPTGAAELRSAWHSGIFYGGEPFYIIIGKYKTINLYHFPRGTHIILIL